MLSGRVQVVHSCMTGASIPGVEVQVLVFFFQPSQRLESNDTLSPEGSKLKRIYFLTVGILRI